jgi:hypothetical protein
MIEIAKAQAELEPACASFDALKKLDTMKLME